MSDRPSHRGGRGQGSHPRGGRGGGRGGGAGGAQQERERPKKENILDLGKYMDKQITVKFNGGREGMFGRVMHGIGCASNFRRS
jgi:U6 snRNA-associated Sm-like protein LSm7